MLLVAKVPEKHKSHSNFEAQNAGFQNQEWLYGKLGFLLFNKPDDVFLIKVVNVLFAGNVCHRF